MYSFVVNCVCECSLVRLRAVTCFGLSISGSVSDLSRASVAGVGASCSRGDSFFAPSVASAVNQVWASGAYPDLDNSTLVLKPTYGVSIRIAHSRFHCLRGQPGWDRGSYRTPLLANIDLRVLKFFPVGKTSMFDVVAEAFTLFNRPNTAQVNPVYGVGVRRCPVLFRPRGLVQRGSNSRWTLSFDARRSDDR